MFNKFTFKVVAKDVRWPQRDSNPQPLSSYTNTQPFIQAGQFGYIVECPFTN